MRSHKSSKLKGSHKGSRLRASPISWRSLKPQEKSAYKRTLSGLRLMRKGNSLRSAAKAVGTDPETMKKYLKGVLYKKRRRWHAKREDSLQRGIIIYTTKGRIRSVVVNRSSTASLIGRHMNDVKLVLSGIEDYDIFAERYKDAIITDSDGRQFRLETDLEELKEIMLKKEQIEYAEFYD